MGTETTQSHISHHYHCVHSLYSREGQKQNSTDPRSQLLVYRQAASEHSLSINCLRVHASQERRLSAITSSVSV